jgi:DNA-binding XRE family transcriptional regulator
MARTSVLRTQNLRAESNSAFLRRATHVFEMQRRLHARNRLCMRSPATMRFAFSLESFTAMRRGIADWSAAALAVAILGLGGLLVIKPAADQWDDVYRADPFVVGTTTQKVQKRLPATGGKNTRPRVSRTTTTTTEESSSLLERLLGKSGTLLLRLVLVIGVAWLAAALLQRALLGSYGLRIPAPAPPARSLPEPVLNGAAPHPADDADTAVVPVQHNGADKQNGAETPPEPAGANFGPAIAKLVASRREAMGLSQRELGKRAGISHTVISRIEGGEHSPSPKTLERLADALS